jgi:threonine/homoserine/homoserine lactone efflux protein
MLSDVIGDLLPSAVGVALSPVPIIAVILMLSTPRARTTGPAFAAGWVIGLIVVSAIVLAVAGNDSGTDQAPSTTVSVIKIVFGVLFYGLVAKQWRSRPRPGQEPVMPPWMATIDGFSLAKCGAMGALLSGVNPKNLALTFAAAATIAEAGLSGGENIVAVATFVIIGSVSVVGPVLFFMVAGSRATRPLASIKEFMSAHVAVIMMVIFAVLGAKLIGAGIAGL